MTQPPTTTAEQQRFESIDLDGRRLAYLDLGDPAGPPIMLVHGMFSAAWSWQKLAPVLVAQGRRVIVPELRGHGSSAPAQSYRFGEFADDLAGLLDRLGIRRLDLIGHSLGGHVGTLLAQRRPTLIRRLVIEDAPPPPVAGDRYRGVGLRALPPRARALILGVLVFRYRWLKRTIDLPMARQVLAEFRRPDPAWWAALCDITAPTMVIAGGGSSHVPLARLQVVAATIPDCRLVTYDVGHRVHNTIPAEYSALVREFLGDGQNEVEHRTVAGR